MISSFSSRVTIPRSFPCARPITAVPALTTNLDARHTLFRQVTKLNRMSCSPHVRVNSTGVDEEVVLRSGLGRVEPLALYFSNAAFDELDDLRVADIQVEGILGGEKTRNGAEEENDRLRRPGTIC